MTFSLIPQKREWRGTIAEFHRFLIADGLDPETADAFIEYHLSKKEVWNLYEQLVLKAIESGRFKRWGSKDALVFVKTCLKMRGVKCFIHNSFSAYYSRLFKFKHPKHKKFLREKRIKGLKKPQVTFKEAA